MTKKILSMMLAISMLFSMCVVNVSAGEAPTIKVEVVEATYVVGNSVEVDVILENNPGFVTAGIPVKWDNTALKLTEVKDHSAVIPGWYGGKIGAGNSYTLAWNNNTATDDYTDNGVLCTMVFQILEGASIDSTYAITIDMSGAIANVSNAWMDDIKGDFTFEAGSVKLVAAPCEHVLGTLVPEVPATHTATKLEAGMKAYYYCDLCETYFDADKNETTEAALVIPAPTHSVNTAVWVSGETTHWHACECGYIESETAHSGTATCKDLAVCAECGATHGTYAEHIYGTLISEVSATHTADKLEAGKKAHYKCSVCEKFFNESKTEVQEDDLVIPAPTHVYGNTWASGNSQHWHACECGAKKDVASCEDKNSDNKCDTCQAVMCEHTSISPVAKVGEDCDTDGVKAHYECDACHAKFSDAEGKNSVTDEELKIPAHHTLGEWNELVAAWCEQPGTKGYYYCSACEKNFEADGKTEITDLTIPALEHDYTLEGGSAATCIAKAKCGRCGEEYGEKDENNHVGGDQIEYNETQHWGICACTKPMTPEDHKGGTATCVAKAECEVCHQLYGEVDANAHIWKEIERQEATKEAEGWIKYECELNAEHTKTEVLPKLPSAVITPVGPSKDEVEDKDDEGETDVTVGKNFSDVKSGDWFYGTVEYVVENGLMNGTSDATFAPYADTTRAMIVTILWRLEGEPAPLGNCQFTDVPAGAWYAEAVTWAAEKGIVTGLTATEFGPDANITREQFATILWRYAKNYKGYDVSVGEDTNILSYTDAFSVSEYAIPAMQWACGAGLINGIDGALQPAGFANRAQAATILARFCQNYQ